MVYITRKEHFSSAHRLFRSEYSNEQNLSVFGKCSNPLWHGHNYILMVTVKGEPDPETGFVMDLKILSRLIEENKHGSCHFSFCNHYLNIGSLFHPGQ